MIELLPRVGDFVASGEPLFRLFGGAATLGDRVLQAQVALGPERTIEQDSTFAFRVVVDIAIKALSQAINDPTTAVLALDQLHRLLRVVGRRHLHRDSVHDDRGELRLILPTPNWDDFVELTFSEIRLYRRIEFPGRPAALCDARRSDGGPAGDRRPALQRQLHVLNQTVERLHLLAEDLALARHPDQGLGGSATPYEA